MAEVSYDPPTGLPDASVLSEAALSFVKISDATARDEALRTVFKLIDAVLAAPEDSAKRRVKKANATFHQKVGRHTSAVDFLRGVGFVDSVDGVESCLAMHVAYISRLTDAHHILAKAAQEVGFNAPPLPAGSFNPFQSACQKTDGKGAVGATSEWRSEAQRLHDEVKKQALDAQEQMLNAPPVPLRPSCFWLSAGRKITEVIQETAELPEEAAGDSTLLLSGFSSTSKAAAGDAKFQSADKSRLAELARTRVHERCVLRVICPDKSVLQAHFRAADTGKQVMAQLAPLLSSQVRKAGWYLYQAPPVKRLAENITLAAAGLSPGANVYLGLESSNVNAPYIADSLASKLGRKPQEIQGSALDAAGAGEGRKLGMGSDAAPPTASEGPSRCTSFCSENGSNAKGKQPLGKLQRNLLSKDKNLKAGAERLASKQETSPPSPAQKLLLEPLEQSEAVKPGVLSVWFPFCCGPPTISK